MKKVMRAMGATYSLLIGFHIVAVSITCSDKSQADQNFASNAPEPVQQLLEARKADKIIPREAQITSFSNGGSGCSLALAKKPKIYDGKVIVLNIPAMTAEVGGDAPIKDMRKFCQVNFNLEYSGDVSYAIEAFHSKVDLALDGQQTAALKLLTYVGGETPQAEASHQWTGEQLSDEPVFDYLDRLIYTPCTKGRSLNVKSEIKLDRQGEGTATLKGPLYLILKWKNCTP